MPIGEVEEEELYLKDPTNVLPGHPPQPTPEEALLIAILRQALEDATIIRNPVQNRLITKEEWREAIDWIMTEEHNLHGFDWAINSLRRIGQSPNDIRERIRKYRCPDCGVFVAEEPCQQVLYENYCDEEMKDNADSIIGA